MAEKPGAIETVCWLSGVAKCGANASVLVRIMVMPVADVARNRLSTLYNIKNKSTLFSPTFLRAIHGPVKKSEAARPLLFIIPAHTEK